MKRIGIDARLYFQTGVGVYLRNLLYYLEQEPFENTEFFVYCMNQDQHAIHFRNPSFKKRPVVSRWHSFSEQSSFFHVLQKDNLDLMHFTYFSYPVLYQRPFISTIHDVTPLRYKTGKASTKNKAWYELKYNVFRFVMKSQMKNSVHIITPTKTIKKELIEVYGLPYESKITPLYEGVNRELTLAKENKSLSKIIGSDYLLYVGNFYPHKNVERLIEAMKKTNSPTRLVLIGPHDFFSKRIESLIEESHMNRQIHLFHGASSEDLVYAYKHAKALINPSLSEGFGLPLVEAMYFDLPVLASRIDVFKELMGDNYHAFDPKDVESIASVIRSFFSNPHKHSYQKLLANYSFKHMAKETFHLYKTYV